MGDIGYRLPAQLPGLRRYAQALARDSITAEDLVQTCLVRALARQHQWREGTNLRAWLFTILHNEFANHVRRRAREEGRLPAAEIGLASLPGSDPEMSCRVAELQQALDRLPARQRELVLRIGLDCQSYEDAAASLGVPVGTVRSRVARGRERLREMTDRQIVAGAGGAALP